MSLGFVQKEARGFRERPPAKADEQEEQTRTPDAKRNMSYRSYFAPYSTYSAFSGASFMGVFAIGSAVSVNSFLSIFSVNSVASVASVNSVASVGCVDGLGEVCVPPTLWIVVLCAFAVVFLNVACFSIFERCPNATPSSSSTAAVLVAANVI